MPELTTKSLEESSVETDPLRLFQLWFTDAQNAGLLLAEGMVLATVNKAGRPTARMVLLKQADERGFVFFTNYESRKASDLEANPYASLVFHWASLEYQVRVEGAVTRTSAEESDAYFKTRLRESQIGAIASPQSKVIPNREWLEQRVAELTKEFGATAIERPANWGGYRLQPDRFEFWKGRVGRLHDRLLYELQPEGRWSIQRLAP